MSFLNIYKSKKVFVTGHTGFKGSWLISWLEMLGAEVTGFSVDIPTVPSMFAAIKDSISIRDLRGDVRDADLLKEAVVEAQPDIIFHLAAQSNVLRSYREPSLTIDTNLMGTVNTLNAALETSSVQAVVSITSDKCYKNKEQIWGYNEDDELGGYDTYSSSKAMAELAISSFRKSFFNDERCLIASTRAGNVIGGGDFADNRLVPDCMKALMAGEEIYVRNPGSVRPWQHVLEPLSGYLHLGAELLRGKEQFASAWNFGPKEIQGITTGQIAEKSVELWKSGSCRFNEVKKGEEETKMLRLNWDKAAHYLQWQPVYNWIEALTETVQWFKAFNNGEDMLPIVHSHIKHYCKAAENTGVTWSNND